MSESDETKLWCWVLGDKHTQVFSVSIKRSATIEDLKKGIQERKPSFKDIAADSLELFKFQLPLENFNEDCAQSIKLEDGQLLESWKRISFYWKEGPVEDILSVILPRPAGTTITSSPSQNSNLSLNPPPSWLVEIHSKLWGRRDLFGQIFRTANLTEADFIELQRQLQELNPERDSESYMAKDVLTTKSAFLRSRSTALVFGTNLGEGLVPRLDFDASQPPFSDVVDDDAVADDDMDIDPDHCANGHINTHRPNEAAAIFPYTIRYVDLTVLQLKTTDLRVPQLMLFRNEWGSMIDIFNKREKGMRGSAVFTGQPGIGKRCLLYSILILCIISAQSIVFQDMVGKVFIIDDTVRPPKCTPAISKDVSDVLTLIDADGKSCQPNEYFFLDYKYRILLTSSPRGRKDRKWLTQRVDDPYAVFVMEPWSRGEFLVASLFLQGTDITLKRFQQASHICGNIPRPCFKAAQSPDTLLNATTLIKAAITETKELSDAVLNINRGDTFHCAFQIRPSKIRFWDSCLIEPVSNWALSEMMAELCRQSVDAAYKLYCAIQGSPNSSVLRGMMFETRLHTFLRTMQTPRTFTIESLDNRSNTLKIHFTSNTNHTFGAMKYFSSHLASSVKSNTSCYLQPLSPIFPSFDSFLYQPEISQSSFSPLIALQVTTTADHAISIKGLEKVQKSLKPKVSELKDLRPTTARKMIILFVVPDTLGAAFVKQTIKDAAKVGHWYEKTVQYVLMLSEKEVFQAT